MAITLEPLCRFVTYGGLGNAFRPHAAEIGIALRAVLENVRAQRALIAKLLTAAEKHRRPPMTEEGNQSRNKVVAPSSRSEMAVRSAAGSLASARVQRSTAAFDRGPATPQTGDRCA